MIAWIVIILMFAVPVFFCILKYILLAKVFTFLENKRLEGEDVQESEDNSESDYTSWAYLPGTFAE